MTEPTWRVINRTDKDLLTHLCHLRGFDPENLTPTFIGGLRDPWLLPNIKSAVKLIVQARRDGWPIAIFGDYDADGTPAAALLSIVFERLGLEHQVYLPSRQSGYGLKKEVVKEIGKSARLLITVDTGITAIEEIKLAKQLGLKTIVLDHHLPKTTLPEADAIVDPMIPTNRYPFLGLCGCALAFKFAQALSQEFHQLTEGFVKQLLDLVAVSTVTDMVPLTDENRVLVYYGLIVLRQNRRIGLRWLLSRSGIKAEELDSGKIAFAIGPRLNASGRLSDNRPAFDLLVSQDEQIAANLAQTINDTNRTRQDLLEQAIAEADKLVFAQNQPSDRVLTILQPNWPTGLVGLIAGRLVKKHNRPVIAGSIIDGILRASGRSIEPFSLIEALDATSQYLDQYGGHKQAAGLSLHPNKWLGFSKLIKDRAAATVSLEDLQPRLLAEAIIDEGELNLKLAHSLEQLSPFGMGNLEPLLMLENAELLNKRVVGSKSNHSQVSFSLGSKKVDGIGFNLAEKFKAAPDKVNLIGKLQINRWQNLEKLQFNILDYQPTGSRIERIDGQTTA